MNIKRRIAVIAGVAAALTTLGISTAQAAGDINRSGSCKLSANWTVNVSANFNDTSSSTEEFLDYVVMTSPGKLDGSGTSSTDGSGWGAYGSGGSPLRDTGYSWSEEFNGTTNKWVYRADPNTTLTNEARFSPMAYTGIRCIDYNVSSTPKLYAN